MSKDNSSIEIISLEFKFHFVDTAKLHFIVTRLNGESCQIKMKN